MKSFYAYLADNRGNPEMAIQMYQNRHGYAGLQPVLQESMEEAGRRDEAYKVTQQVSQRVAQEYVDNMDKENLQELEWEMFLTMCDNIVLTTNFRRQMKRSN